jgi:hypothetical protein
MTLDEWTQVIKNGGKGMNADKAAGIFHSSLERLAMHYGVVDERRLKSISNDMAYSRAVRDVFEFAAVFATSAQPGEKTLIMRFLDAAKKRFGKFA